MNPSHLKPNLALLLTVIVTLLLLAPSLSIAQDTTCTLSGRVVDAEDNPVTRFPLIIQQTKLINGHAITMRGDFSIPLSVANKTDDAGRFFITEVMHGPVQLIGLPPIPQKSQKSYEILSMKIGKITFYPTTPSHIKGIMFSIEPGAHLENVKITVRPRTRYRGKVVSKDGAPFRNTEIRLDVQNEYNKGRNRTEMKDFLTRTDSDGYFVRYVDELDFDVAFYTVAVKYEGLSATAEFTLKSGEQRDDLVFTLQGTPMSMQGQIVFKDGTSLSRAMFVLDVRSDNLDKNSPHHSNRQPVTDYAGYFTEYLNQPRSYIASVEYQGLSATSKFTVKLGDERKELVFTLNDTPIFDRMGLMAPTVPNTLGVWMGAPNGSQYKSIRCSSWQDAQTKARMEGAQLVSINDKTEQKWLVEHFGFLPYWIGLTYSVEADEWQWSSGEPVTYTNWLISQPENPEAESYGSMDGDLRGQWRALGPRGGGILSGYSPRAAILEKKRSSTTAPLGDK